MSEIDKKIVWDDSANGKVWVTHLDSNDKSGGESDDEFVTRYTAKLKLNPRFADLTPVIMLKADIPSDRKDRRKWRIKNGKVKVDKAVVLEDEVKRGHKVSAKAKLKSGQPLTDAEADAIIT
jgi:hypothetical protein